MCLRMGGWSLVASIILKEGNGLSDRCGLAGVIDVHNEDRILRVKVS